MPRPDLVAVLVAVEGSSRPISIETHRNARGAETVVPQAKSQKRLATTMDGDAPQPANAPDLCVFASI
jgi:hypothetical protein